jgi:hypothetical protein
MNKPNLFIPGFPKSGTSALHSAMIMHEQISDCGSKEPHTYTWDERYKQRKLLFNKKLKVNHQSNLHYYLDSSTSYMVSNNAIERINKDNSEAKFIIIARDPIDRIVSHYNWLSSLDLINKSPLEELKNHLHEKFNYRNHYKYNYKAYLDFSLYGDKMQNIQKFVDKKNILFFLYEDIFKNENESKEKLSNFLNLDMSEINFIIKNKTNFKNERNKPLIRNIRNKVATEIGYLKGLPKSIKVKNPSRYKTNRSEIESLLLPYFENDLYLLKGLGYNIEKWETYQKIIDS